MVVTFHIKYRSNLPSSNKRLNMNRKIVLSWGG